MEQINTIAQKVLSYHEGSKHHPDRYAPSLGYMDWENQPNPFRFYAGATRLALPLMQEPIAAAYNALYDSSDIMPLPIGLESVAGFLELALGLSAWKQLGGSEWPLRMNPSSGNLHPTEAYLLLPECTELPACIAHYNPYLHSLEIRARLDDEAAESLKQLNGFGLMLSSIFWREAWKYGERAFRYTQHDIGHALGALRFSASLCGWRLSVQPEIGTDRLNQLLGFTSHKQHEGETERVDCMCWVSGTKPNCSAVTHWFSTLRPPHYADTPNQLSPSHVDWPVIDETVLLTASPGFHPQQAAAMRSAMNEPSLQSAESIIRKRRSAQAYDPDGSRMSYQQFVQILMASLPSGAAPFDLLPTSTHLHLVIFVHRVDGLDSGLYCFVRNASALHELRESFINDFSWQQADPSVPLYLLQQGNFRTIASSISCHQEIAGDSAFSLGMLARFESLVGKVPWLYPCLYWEAGLIGQALYLAAEEKGFRGTGIGCYFDDLMHELLGLNDHQWQDLYHFTIGSPLEDSRLQTKPAYHHLPGL